MRITLRELRRIIREHIIETVSDSPEDTDPVEELLGMLSPNFEVDRGTRPGHGGFVAVPTDELKFHPRATDRGKALAAARALETLLVDELGYEEDHGARQAPGDLVKLVRRDDGARFEIGLNPSRLSSSGTLGIDVFYRGKQA